MAIGFQNSTDSWNPASYVPHLFVVFSGYADVVHVGADGPKRRDGHGHAIAHRTTGVAHRQVDATEIHSEFARHPAVRGIQS